MHVTDESGNPDNYYLKNKHDGYRLPPPSCRGSGSSAPRAALQSVKLRFRMMQLLRQLSRGAVLIQLVFNLEKGILQHSCFLQCHCFFFEIMFGGATCHKRLKNEAD